jgi:ABC-type polysaccharide/polyol phosphate transport system ATPase subunit
VTGAGPIIEVRDIAKAFRIPSVRRDTLREHVFSLFEPRAFEALRVLDSVSFEVAAGETVGIMGRNGSGKSTLLKILCGIYRPDRGTATVRAAVTPILELGVGWNPELDAVDNILLIGTVMGLGLREARGAIDRVLAFAGLGRFAKLQLKYYSTGMAARLAYSVAFAAVREVLVLDEILAVGDAEFRSRCEARYRELRGEGHTVLLVSHEPRTVATYCDRALLLEGGRVVLDGSPEAVIDAYLGLEAAAPRAAASHPESSPT